MSTKTICNWTVIAGGAFIIIATVLLFLSTHFLIGLDWYLSKRLPVPFFFLIGGVGLVLFALASLTLVLLSNSSESFRLAKLYFLGSALVVGLLFLIAQNVHDGTLLLILPFGMSLLLGLLFVLAGIVRVIAARYKA